MAEPGVRQSERFRELCRRLSPILGKRMGELYRAYSLEDPDGRKQLEAYVEALAAKHLGNDLDQEAAALVPPSAERLSGPYELGTVAYAGRQYGTFGLRENEWIQHLGVFGRSGAGKTNLGFEIFRQLIRHGKPVLVFDWKRNYRDLTAQPEFQQVDVYTAGRDVAPFRFNPLIPPPGTDPHTWLKQLIEVVAHAYLLGNGVLYLLQQTLDGVYQDHGVYEGNVELWPTFREVMAKAQDREARGRESAWLSSTLRALSSLNFGEMDKLLNTPHDQSRELHRLLEKPAILELDSLSQADKVFLTSALLLYIHHLRMAEGEREVFKHAILIEEAHHILSNERRSLIGGQSVMEITFREIREFGEAIVALDQHPSKISLSALGNTYCTICFNLKHQKDVNAMAQSMLLDTETKDILGSLDVGEAVVKLQGRAPQPFMIQVPEFTIHKGTITDNALRLHAARFDIVPEGHVAPAMFQPSISDSSVSSASEKSRQDPEILFLYDVRDHPESGVAARYKRIGLSVRQGQRLKAKLVEKGVIEEQEERTATGRVRVIRLTEKGRALLKNTGNAA